MGLFYFYYLCDMKYNKGDIIVCSTDELYGKKYHLVVGDQYRIIDVIEIPESKTSHRTVLHAFHIKTNRDIGLVSDKHFIPLQWYREWKINKII